MIEVQSNVLFPSAFGIELAVKNERKRVSKMWENAYLSIKNPKAPWPQMACFVHVTLLSTLATFGLRSWHPPYPNPGSTPGVTDNHFCEISKNFSQKLALN